MSRNELKKKGAAAANKPAPFGPDVDLAAYALQETTEHGKVAR